MAEAHRCSRGNDEDDDARLMLQRCMRHKLVGQATVLAKGRVEADHQPITAWQTSCMAVSCDSNTEHSICDSSVRRADAGIENGSVLILTRTLQEDTHTHVLHVE